MDDETPSQQQTEVNPHWKELADPSSGFTTAIIAMEASEYLRVSYNFESDATTLVRFNGKRNQWESSIVLPDVVLHEVYGFNTDSTLVYGYYLLSHHQDGNIVAVGLESGKWEICKFGNIPTLAMYRGFMINGDLHLLHGGDHIIIHQNGKRTEQEIGDEWKGVSISDAIHSKPRNILILFGLSCDRIPLFAEYSLSTNRWMTWIWPTADSLDIAHCEGAGMVCTAEGRYLMLLGGEGDILEGGSPDRITVCDMTDHEAMVFVSPVSCPKGKDFAAVLVDGSGSWESLVVSGYLRKCYDDLKVEQSRTLAQDLVAHLVKCISMGCIHLVEKEDGKGHWRIPASAVLYPSCVCDDSSLNNVPII